MRTVASANRAGSGRAEGPVENPEPTEELPENLREEFMTQIQTWTSMSGKAPGTIDTKKNIDRLEQFQSWLLAREDASRELGDFFRKGSKKSLIAVFTSAAKKRQIEQELEEEKIRRARRWRQRRL